MTEAGFHTQLIYGPPGTGKTTYLGERIRKSAEHIGGESVVAMSFTRAAATELVGRNLPVPQSNVGTLHAFAYRSIDRPEIADRHLEDWNKDFPAFTLSAGIRSSVDEPMLDNMGATVADRWRQQFEVYRARREPEATWDASVKQFADYWRKWCDANSLVDFTAMVEIALEDVEQCPGAPSVGYFDEVQDFTPLELALVRKWGEHMDHVGLAGDDDQLLYRFKGASVEAFLSGSANPNAAKKVLGQSYRVPRAVHAVASAWIEKVNQREPKEYLPRDCDGKVRVEERWQYKAPEGMVEEAGARADAGESVMVLTTCSYMLDPLKAILRKGGIPFENRYRRDRGDWNPLAPSGQGRTSPTQRVLSYVGPLLEGRQGEGNLWTADEFKRWVATVEAKGLLSRGAKKRSESLGGTQFMSWAEMAQFFESEQILLDAMDGLEDLVWLEQHLLSVRRKPMSFPIQVVRRRGIETLLKEPKLTIGTVHSVKGGQADVVYLFPDLSGAGNAEWTGGQELHDSVIRVFYVAMTRARQELVVCGLSGPGVEPSQLVPHRFIKKAS